MFSCSRVLVSCLVLFIALSTIGYAQVGNDYHIFGKVTDTKGNPIPDAKFTLRDPDSGKHFVFKSKDDGTFDQQFIPHAMYTLTVEKEGYLPRNVDKVDMTAFAEKPIEKKIDVVLMTPQEEEQIKLAEQQAQMIKEVQDLYKKGMDEYQAKQFDTALATMQQVSQKSPESYGPYLVMAACYQAKNDPAQAITYYEKTLTLKKDIPEVYRNLGDLYTFKKDFPKALAAYQNLLQLTPGDAETRCVVANIFLAMDKIADAETNLKQAMTDDPNVGLCYKVNGEYLLKKGDMKGSSASFKKYLELTPNAPDKKNIEEMIAALDQVK